MTPEQTLEWLAKEHFDQCREERPIQDWIRKMKSQLPEQPKQNTVEAVKAVLKGIDQTEIESPDGWWETLAGAEFGAKKLKYVIGLLAQPAAVVEPHIAETHKQEPVAWSEFVELACAKIKAADDAAADRDYMLDSDDCIKVLRGKWKAPVLNDQPTKPTTQTQPKEPEQEPVAGRAIYEDGDVFERIAAMKKAPQRKPWVSLDKEQIKRLYEDYGIGGLTDYEFAQAINSKLRELNEAPQRKPLTDEYAAAIAYKGFDDYWTEDCKGRDVEAWTAAARAVEAAHGIRSDEL